MLYHFLYPLKAYFGPFNVFRYITFRAIGGSVTAFLFCIFFGEAIIKLLKRLNFYQITKRDDAGHLHKFYEGKEDVPSMGGVMIISAVLVSSVLWGNFSGIYMWLILVVMLLFGIVGFADDMLKIYAGNSKGLPAKVKFSGELLVSTLLGIYLYYDSDYQKVLYFPFVKEYVLYLGIFIIPFVVLVIVGSSNALNLTDGLDGLAIGCAVIVAATFAIISYVSGNYKFATYLNIPYIQQSGELAVFCASLVGAGIGFLWFNSYPATVIMGDTGSLAVGGAIGAVAVLIKKELLLFIVGGVFVLEAVSVILQVMSYKFRGGKRIFLCAPFHHHLQLKGWHNAKITIRLWIVAVILALIGLVSLKLM